MDKRHRDIIQGNLIRLKSVRLEELYDELLGLDVVISNDLENLRKKYPVQEEQAIEFFLKYMKRGPKAFEALVYALQSTGHASEADLLLDAHQQKFGNDALDARLSGGLEFNSSGSSGSGSQSSPGSIGNSPAHSRQVSKPNSPHLGGHGHSASAPASKPGSPRLISPKLGLRKTNNHNSSPSPGPGLTMDLLPPLKFEIKNALLYNNGTTKLCYEMMSRPRGYALLINNIEFIGDPQAERRGAEKDSVNLKTVLKMLHFEVTVEHNVKKCDLLKKNGILDTFIAQFNGKRVNSCIVAVMSHGTEGYFMTSDAESLRDVTANRVSIWDEFLVRFNNRNAPQLINIPKIIILQTCRGEEKDRGVRTSSDSIDANSRRTSSSSGSSSSGSGSGGNENLPTYEDMLICQSTVPGFVSNRDVELGTWYINSLCAEICLQAHESEILSILKSVGLRMRTITSEFGVKQMSSFNNTGFHYDYYFNPGLFYEDSENGEDV